MPYHFLPEDFKVLKELGAELERKMKEAGRAAGEAANQGAETHHDNAPFDAAKADQDLFKARLLRVVDQIRHGVEVIPSTLPNDRVTIGKKVTYVEEESGQSRTVRIGSYETYVQPSDAIPVVAYNAPLGKLLIGLKVDEERGGVIGGSPVTVTVARIEQ